MVLIKWLQLYNILIQNTINLVLRLFKIITKNILHKKIIIFYNINVLRSINNKSFLIKNKFICIQVQPINVGIMYNL